MQKKRLLSLILTLALCIGMLPGTALVGLADEPAIPIYMDSENYSYAERAADLVARMTTAQKGNQVYSQNTPSIAVSQLGGGALDVPATAGVPSYTWWQEALHGYLNGQNSNSYPQNVSAANTWNPDLYYDVATAISDEIRERAPQGATVSTNGRNNATNLNFYSPTINMQRDPRWGRNEESYSEDVLLTSKMGTAFVQGMQGMTKEGELIHENGLRKLNPTIKHYVANNSERNRLVGGADTSLRALREYYAAPYRDIIQDADVSSVMTAYSTLNGDPCTLSSYLIDTLLRQTYGFSGHMTGDCDSVSTISRLNYTNPYTGNIINIVEQFSQALAHGMDLQCNGGHGSGSNTYGSQMANMIAQAVETDKGIFTENQLDVSLHRLMTARMQVGEWDSDNAYTQEAVDRIAEQSGSIGWQTSERLKLIDDVNAEGVVMLKNEDNILPLDIPAAGDYNLVIVGNWQTQTYTGLYSGGASDSTNRVTIQKRIVDNVKEINPDATITYLTSYGNATNDASSTITEGDAITIENADAVIVVTGTPDSYSKEDGDRTSIVINNRQDILISNVGKLNDNTIAVMETCGPMQVTQFEDDVAAILWSSYQGLRKVGFGDIITGKVNPSGKLTTTWYQNVNDNGESDVPSIYDYDLFASEGKEGRTYMYFGGTPSYVFGHGLSFTTFEYSDLKVQKADEETTEFNANDTIKVSFNVKNTGAVAGKETTQLYVAQPDAPASLKRPIKRLQGFDKIELAAGETKNVTIEVEIPDLAFYNEAEDRFIVDTGKYEIQVGTNSDIVPLKADINVSGAMNIVPKVVTAKPSQNGDEGLGVEERLIFDKGRTVDPKLTIAMNDESLCGYIIKQQSSNVVQKESTDYPEGMTFEYVSNRPEVVNVDAEGVITAVDRGVATITATVTYNGESASTEFVVYVESTPYVDDITVDGEPIDGLSKGKQNYVIEVPAGTTKVPEIKYSNTNPDNEITVIEEIDTVPGVMIFKSENTLTGESVTYRIGVGFAPETNDFKEGKTAALAKSWSFINENDNAVFGDDGLTITTEQGAFSNAEAPPQNVFMQSALGDWVAQSEVVFEETPTESNQQAGLIVYDDDNNYIRFVYERPTSGSTNVLRVYNVVNGEQSQANSVSLASLTNLNLQIVKEGNVYIFKYSQDGSAWTTFGTSIRVDYALPQIGLYATNGNTEAAPISVTYENLSIYELSDLYPRLASLSVGDKAVEGFFPTTFDYNVEVPANSTEAPVLVATGESDDFIITYEQLETPMGTATVTVASPVASATYTVSFNTGPLSDYFADGTMSSNWTVLRENVETYSVDKGLGVRHPTQRYDIYSTGAAWENVMLQPAMGNWEVVTKVFYPRLPDANYQQAMVLVWQDEDNYIRANCQQSNLVLEPGIERNGSFSSTAGDQAVANEDGTVVLYHKIIKNGSTYTISFSQDGLNFRQLGEPIVVDYRDPKLGMFATMNNSGSQLDTYFEYMTVTSTNGVVQKTYPEMLQDAVNNVRDYIVADIPSKVSTDIDLASIPYGYTATLASNNTSVIAEDGTVTPGNADESVTLTLTVTDGDRTAVSGPINVTVAGSGGEVEETSVKLAVSGTVNSSSSFDVTVSLDTKNYVVYAEDIVVEYDADVFEFVKVTAVDGIEILKDDDAVGKLSIIAASTDGVGVKGNNELVFTLNFKAKSSSAGLNGTISITKAELGVMPGGSVLEATLDSKTIQVGQGDPEPTIDKRALQDSINSAETAYENAEVGTSEGNYLQSDMDALQAAIDTAKAIFNDSSAGQTDIDNATTALNLAIETFEDSVLKSELGDLNGNSMIDIGDLAIAAYYYGATSSSENWANAMRADINGDGKINIADLVSIALKIAE